MKKSFFITIVFVFYCSLFLCSEDTIINDTDNWKGNIWAEESGFLTWDADSKWEQSGANTGSEAIWFLWDNYTPNVANVGNNTVKCTYSSVGWVFTGGPTISDEIKFETVKEIISHKILTTTNNAFIYKKILSNYENGDPTLSVPYELTISGASEDKWEETNTLSDTLTLSAEHKASGEIKLDSLITVGTEDTIGVSNAITATRTTSKSGSQSSSLSTKIGPIIVPPGGTVKVFAQVEGTKEEIEIKFYKDSDKNGLSEGETDKTVTAIGNFSTKLINTP